MFFVVYFVFFMSLMSFLEGEMFFSNHWSLRWRVSLKKNTPLLTVQLDQFKKSHHTMQSSDWLNFFFLRLSSRGINSLLGAPGGVVLLSRWTTSHCLTERFWLREHCCFHQRIHQDYHSLSPDLTHFSWINTLSWILLVFTAFLTVFFSRFFFSVLQVFLHRRLWGLYSS